jgi:hypothetical protein
VTVFTRWDAKAVKGDPAADRQRQFDVDTAIGKMARTIYDYYAG